jgi:putative transcriptional regulator
VIKCHLSRLMGERKLKIADVARATGLYRGTVSLLYDETAAKVDLETVDRLCAYLGVTVGELFEQVEPLPDLSGVEVEAPAAPREAAKARKR